MTEHHDYTEALELYNKGLNDVEISKATGIPVETIHAWRKRHHLPHYRVDTLAERNARMLELYKTGVSDGKIAKELGCDIQNVGYWRKRNKLKANYPVRRIDEDKVMDLYLAGYNDEEIRKVVGFDKSAIFRWRFRNNLPANHPHSTRKAMELIGLNAEPMEDPESLFCDGEFLSKLTRKDLTRKPATDI